MYGSWVRVPAGSLKERLRMIVAFFAFLILAQFGVVHPDPKREFTGFSPPVELQKV